MPSHADGREDVWDYDAEWDRIIAISDLDERLDACEAYFTRMLVLRYGEDIISLSEDDQRLIAYMKSGETELQRMALASLLELRYLFHTQIVDICANYIKFGADIHIRLDCVRYLDLALTSNYDDHIANFLQNCAQRLIESRITKDDDIVVASINFYFSRRRA